MSQPKQSRPRRTRAGPAASGSGPAAAGTATSAPRGRSEPSGTEQPPASVAEGQDAMLESLETLRELVSRGLLRQLEVVMLSRDRIQDALDDAVVRGRMTRGDAEDLFTELFRRGRRQTEDLIGELEQLVGRAGDQLGTAAKRATPKPPDRVIREADRVRRVAGVGPSFPIVGYDDLTAAKVADRLGDLTPAELRKVRDYERRTANRKSVLAAIEKALR